MDKAQKHWLLILATLAIAWWLMTGGVPILDYLKCLVGRGKRLTSATWTDAGNISETPDALAAAAAKVAGREVSQDLYTIARMIASEHPEAGDREKAAMAQVLLNDKARTGKSILFTATSGKGYGHQSGRKYATAKDPFERDLAIAESVYTGAAADETRGSVHFVHKSGFASLGKYKALCAEWNQTGHIVPIALEGIPSFRIFLPESQYAAEQVLPATVANV
jgi:hypothetical protein